MKQGYFGALIAAGLLTISACSETADSDLDNDGSDLFDVTVKVQDADGTLRDTFYPSETLRMVLNIENVSDSAYSITFEDEQKFDFEVTNSDDEVVWTWSDGQTFDSTATFLALEPEESYGARHNWNLLLKDSSMLPAGKYTLTGEFLHVDEVASATFTLFE